MISNRQTWFRRICIIIILLAIALTPLASVSDSSAQAAETLQPRETATMSATVADKEIPQTDIGKSGNRLSHPYLVRTFVDDEGREIDEVIVPGRPPEIKAAVATVPEPNTAMGITVLPNVPAFDWSYGCSATSAAMLFGYYDRTGYSNMYTGVTNGGVCPLDNSIWGETVYPSVTCHECPLSATHQGTDGRTLKGYVDDYWIDYGNAGPDPYISGNWTRHNDDCTGDFMGTSQSSFSNSDGGTRFFFYPNGDPLYDYTWGEPSQRDGCHGMRLFAQSRGYSVITNFTQYIKGQGTDSNKGFTFDDFMAEIDAGRTVLIQVVGHTMLGYGYNTAGNIVYIHDTWDHSNHQMTWGGTYSPMLLQHWGVTVIRLATTTPTPTISFSPASFSFSAPVGGSNPPNQTLQIWNSGGGTLNWSVSDNAVWLTLSPPSGSSTGEHDSVTATVNIAGMSSGSYPAVITISAPGATNTPRTVPVSLTINNPPNIPSNPSPTNYATGVSVNTDLSWTGGDPDAGDTVTYDLYFGTSANPPLVSSHKTATTYDPATLAYNTKYYWKIVATDSHAAATTGPVWDFTTGLALNNPPNMPSNPSPTNHAAGVSVNPHLSWTGGDPNAGDTVTYDVYFGTSVTPPLVSNHRTATTYDPGTLAYGTKYYWKIVATDNHAATTTGPVWDFTTALPAKPVMWNCPLGGQALIAPYPGAGRPFLSVAAACSAITVSAGAQLWGIYYLDETTGTWLYYIPGFAGNTLTQLEPGKYYYVVVSGACTLQIPQG